MSAFDQEELDIDEYGEMAAAQVQEDPVVTLLNAAEDGDIDAIEQVISDKPGIQVDSRDTLGWTPLLWAAYKGHFKVAALLLRLGAATSYGSRPAPPVTSPIKSHHGLHKSSSSFAAISSSSPSRDTLRHLNVPPKVDPVQARNVSLKAFGDTPLNWAAWRGHESIVWLFLENGFDTGEVGNYGNTPLHAAAAGGQVACVRALLEYGCVANALNRSRQPPSALSKTPQISNLILSLVRATVCKACEGPLGLTPQRRLCGHCSKVFCATCVVAEKLPGASRQSHVCVDCGKIVQEERRAVEEKREREEAEKAAEWSRREREMEARARAEEEKRLAALQQEAAEREAAEAAAAEEERLRLEKEAAEAAEAAAKKKKGKGKGKGKGAKKK